MVLWKIYSRANKAISKRAELSTKTKKKIKPWEFHYLWEDIELSLYSADRKSFMKDKSGKFHDLTDYGAIKLLKALKKAFNKSDKEHSYVDDRFL